MQNRWFPLAALLLISGISAAAAEEPHVTIKVNPPKVTHHTFDKAHPPANMPKLKPTESGVCHFEFTSDAGLGVFVDQKDARTVEFEADTVDIVLDLPIQVCGM